MAGLLGCGVFFHTLKGIDVDTVPAESRCGKSGRQKSQMSS